jgi:ankyrin repeat protein
MEADHAALGERLVDVIGFVCASGFATDLHCMRFLCGATYREGARRADGSFDTRGYLGATADMIASSLRLQAPWLAAARARPRDKAHWVRTQLIHAADRGDERRVRELLAAGAAPGSTTSLGQTALHCACWRGHESVVSALLERGGEQVNLVDAFGATPLMRASFQGHAAVVRLLLEHGADQAVQSLRGGRAALHRAAYSGRAGVVALLCAAPGAAAALALRDRDGRTPLEVALAFGRTACVSAMRGEEPPAASSSTSSAGE